MRIILVANGPEEAWRGVLREAAAPLGEVWTVSNIEDYMNQDITDDIVILDAGGVDDVERSIAELCARRPLCRVVVVTASPTWQRARAAFEAGATDYLSKAVDSGQLRTALKMIAAPAVPARHRSSEAS